MYCETVQFDVRLNIFNQVQEPFSSLNKNIQYCDLKKYLLTVNIQSRRRHWTYTNLHNINFTLKNVSFKWNLRNRIQIATNRRRVDKCLTQLTTRAIFLQVKNPKLVLSEITTLKLQNNSIINCRYIINYVISTILKSRPCFAYTDIVYHCHIRKHSIYTLSIQMIAQADRRLLLIKSRYTIIYSLQSS